MRWLSVVAGLVLGAGLFAGGTHFGADVWPGSDTVVETKVEYQLPAKEQLREDAWRLYADAQTESAARLIYAVKVRPLCVGCCETHQTAGFVMVPLASVRTGGNCEAARTLLLMVRRW